MVLDRYLLVILAGSESVLHIVVLALAIVSNLVFCFKVIKSEVT